MGGWRCTFRNCSAAADGKTHVFHYPVFDKARCLMWLKNAGRLEFLNLKLSQLRNRVVCQHHFKDECFMNYKKDKLTFVAVPTENGCLSSTEDLVFEEVSLPVTLECIENSEMRLLTAREKKANHSTIYANFLTDPIIHSVESIPEIDCNRKPQTTEKDDDSINFQIWSHKPQDSETAQKTPVVTTSHSVYQPLCNSEYIQIGITENIHKGILDTETVPVQDLLNILEAPPNTADNLNSNKHLFEDIVSSSQINPIGTTETFCNNLNITVNQENKIMCKSNNKVKIISEETLSIPVMGTFKPEFPMKILNPLKRKVDLELTNKENAFSSTTEEEPHLPKVQTSGHPVEHKLFSKPHLLEPKTNSKITSPPNKIQKGNLVNNSKSPSKVPLERIIAIEEKRNFNKKLRDMIEFCLDDKEENTKTHVNMKSIKTSQTEESIESQQIKNNPLHKKSEKCTTKSTSSNLKQYVKDNEETKSTVKEKGVIRGSETKAVVPDYKLTVLEARLSRMESLLLKKVGENTQRIDNLKQSLSKSNDKKRSIQTQTMQDPEMHKKQLFHEISKYLSSDLKSSIYEELFMKEYKPTKRYSKVSKKKADLSPLKNRPR